MVAGEQNLENLNYIKNKGTFKTVFNGFMQKHLSVKDPEITKEKQRFDTNYPIADNFIGPIDFQPFKEERDHLGRLINSVSLLKAQNLCLESTTKNWWRLPET